jgi:DNA-binding PucR family transcriptional regulator
LGAASALTTVSGTASGAASGSASPQGLTGLRNLTDLALITVTASARELGDLLASELLASLDPADHFHRDLAETALAYLDHGGRIEPTAAALHVHPNTVKYRIRRFHDLVPSRLTGTIPQTTHWWWALTTWLHR